MILALPGTRVRRRPRGLSVPGVDRHQRVSGSLPAERRLHRYRKRHSNQPKTFHIQQPLAHLSNAPTCKAASTAACAGRAFAPGEIAPRWHGVRVVCVTYVLCSKPTVRMVMHCLLALSPGAASSRALVRRRACGAHAARTTCPMPNGPCCAARANRLSYGPPLPIGGWAPGAGRGAAARLGRLGRG